jgi:DNA polymerase III epsilon subunit-like protein
MRLHFCDTETASLQGGVVDLAIVEVDASSLVELARFETLLDPQRPIEEGAMEIHGITDADVAGMPTLRAYYDQVGRPFNQPGLIFAGHNAEFDARMLGEVLPPGYRRLCTLKVARHFMPEMPNHKLQTLRDLLGLPGGTAHRAMGDVQTCLHLFGHFLKMGITLEQMLDVSMVALTRKSKLTFGQYKGKSLEKLPADYVDWLLTKAVIKPELRAALESL